jgi:hypothetical protein
MGRIWNTEGHTGVGQRLLFRGLWRTGYPAFAGYDGPYSAGLASGGGVVAAWAAAFFSTMPTAMIEPS